MWAREYVLYFHGVVKVTDEIEGYSEMLIALSEVIVLNHTFKKSEFYPENPPSWLADEFDIKWMRYTNLFDQGYTFLSPYEDFVGRCPLFFDKDKKYDVVIMWIGGEGTDIKLF